MVENSRVGIQNLMKDCAINFSDLNKDASIERLAN